MGVWFQTRLLESDELFSKDFGRGHACEGGRCDIRCLNAVHEKCRCRCGGRNHGYFQRIKNSKLDSYRDYLWLNHIKKLRKFFEDKKCLSCGSSLIGSNIFGYPHENGLWIQEYEMRLWVFCECRKCGYQNAFRKFEVDMLW